MEAFDDVTMSGSTLIDRVEKYSAVEKVEIERGGPAKVAVLSVPAGRTVLSIKKLLDEYRERPERRAGNAIHTTLDSFIEHADRFKDEHSVIFADVENIEQAKLISVLDYHEKTAAGRPRFGEHRGIYHFPLSDEWKAWTRKSGQLSQQDFAEFLEDRIVDVRDPSGVGESIRAFAEQLGVNLASPQRLLELSRGLTIRVGAKVVNHVNLSTGEAQIGFEEKHEGEAGGSIKVPGGFAIAIPVFRGGAHYQIPVRLRYRIVESRVCWWLSLQRLDRYRDDAVAEACTKAKDATGLPLFFGKPEV